MLTASNIKHLQEINDSGLEMPAVNQLEVSPSIVLVMKTPELTMMAHANCFRFTCSVSKNPSLTYARLTVS